MVDKELKNNAVIQRASDLMAQIVTAYIEEQYARRKKRSNKKDREFQDEINS